jgi:diguanylate cyclase (GGDEF)-like protein/PAS domain S-box-containing protein
MLNQTTKLDQSLPAVIPPKCPVRTDRSSERGLFWWAADGSDLPDWCLAAEVMPIAEKRESGAGAAYFVPVSASSLGRDIAAVREQLGDDAYLIAVVDAALSPTWSARVISLGADDVMDVTATPDVVIARARRALARQSAHVARLEQVASDRAFLQTCIDTLPSPIFYKDRQGRYIGCNKAFSAFIGRSRAEVLGSTVYDVAPPDLAKTYEDADEALMQERGVQIYEAKVCFAADDRRHTVSFHKAAMIDEHGEVIGLAGAMLDITEQKALEARLIDAAERDPLTNCYNRRKFFTAGAAMVEEAIESADPLSVMVLDIDHFKTINDRFGHAGGDVVLLEVAERLDDRVRGDGLLARAGGEEFFVVMKGKSLDDAVVYAEMLRNLVARDAVPVSSGSVTVTVSIGVAQLHADDGGLNDVLKRADEALYAAKASGRNRVHRAEIVG